MTKTPDFKIFKGEREWHIADKHHDLIGDTGSPTLKQAQQDLFEHLDGLPFTAERIKPGEYAVYLTHFHQYDDFVGKTIAKVTGNHYGDTPFSLTIIFTDGTKMDIDPSRVDFGHGDISICLSVK